MARLKEKTRSEINVASLTLTGCVLPDGSRRRLHLQSVLPMELSELARLLSLGREVELCGRFRHVQVLLTLLLLHEVAAGAEGFLALEGRRG